MRQKNLEFKVGLFVLLGLLSAGILIVSFGRFGELFQNSYQLTVQFSNTSGVIKNSQVLYRGARVGTVSTAPQIADAGKFVKVGVKINNDVKIDKDSTFSVGSYGLLGDRFIDVQPPQEPSGQYLKEGDVVRGTKTVGFDDLTKKLEPIVNQLGDMAVDLRKSGAIENLGDSMASIKGITSKLDRLLDQAENGKGTLHALLNDQKTADEIKEMISEFKTLGRNLRKRGVLFYKDLSQEKK